jgi:indole-3-glycerol phosphate synthase
MVSVLCDAPFFDGSWQHVQEVRAALDDAGSRVPLLAKEFVIEERQVQEARDRGADAVLLIARIVEPAQLNGLAEAARAEGVEPLIEVVDERELQDALAAGARIVGVNVRDLDTLQMDADRASRVTAAVPRGVVAVHLSGVRNAADAARVASGRADAALVGEALMRVDHPGRLLSEMCAAAAGKSPRPE